MNRVPGLLALAAGVFLQTARADDAKHVDRVTDAAKAAFEKMSKAAGSPFGKGMKSAAGVLAAEVKGAAAAFKFALSAPAKVRVETDPRLKGDAATAGADAARAAEAVLRLGCGVFEPAEGVAFDADVVKADGRDVLVVTTFEKNVETSRTESALDASGLMTSSTTRGQARPDGAARDVKSQSEFVWSKTDDGWRLDRVTTAVGPERTTVAITYADEAGRPLPVEWRSESAAGVSDFKMSELTIDGARIDLSKPAGAKAAHAHPLGDLSAYAAIAKDTLKLAESGDLKAGKARIKDIETAWDDAEGRTKPLNPNDWETLDKAIDAALAKLRSKTPDQAACVSALKALIATIERM